MAELPIGWGNRIATLSGEDLKQARAAIHLTDPTQATSRDGLDADAAREYEPTATGVAVDERAPLSSADPAGEQLPAYWTSAGRHMGGSRYDAADAEAKAAVAAEKAAAENAAAAAAVDDTAARLYELTSLPSIAANASPFGGSGSRHQPPPSQQQAGSGAASASPFAGSSRHQVGLAFD
jgi:hypothetical protein